MQPANTEPLEAPRKKRRRSRKKNVGDGAQDESVDVPNATATAVPPAAEELAAASAAEASAPEAAPPQQQSPSVMETGLSRKRPREAEPESEEDTMTGQSGGSSFWDSIELPTDDVTINIAPANYQSQPRPPSHQQGYPERPGVSEDVQPTRPRTVKFADEVPPSSGPPQPAQHQGDTDTEFFAQHNPYKPSAVGTHHTLGRAGQTVSLAVPGSVVLNAQSAELRARLVAHIARPAAIFNIDEIVVWHDASPPPAMPPPRGGRPGRGGRGGFSGNFGDRRGGGGGAEDDDTSKAEFDPDQFMVRLLSYLETPQYLRKALIPMHPDLRLAGLLPPLDLPAHVRRDDDTRFREGVLVGPSPKSGRNRGVKGSWDVDVGLWDPVHVVPPSNEDGTSATLEAGQRVTVRMPTSKRNRNAGSVTQEAQLVSHSTPTQEDGTYWGYKVRYAASLADVFKSSTFVPAPDERGVDAYDLVIGTSERGAPLSQVLATTFASSAENAAAAGASGAAPAADEPVALRPFEHALIVFGGVAGLEVAVEHDEGIPLPAGQAHQLFDTWINVAEDQGSRTIRTEEAVLIALARMAPALRGLTTPSA